MVKRARWVCKREGSGPGSTGMMRAFSEGVGLCGARVRRCGGGAPASERDIAGIQRDGAAIHAGHRGHPSGRRGHPWGTSRASVGTARSSMRDIAVIRADDAGIHEGHRGHPSGRRGGPSGPRGQPAGPGRHPGGPRGQPAGRCGLASNRVLEFEQRCSFVRSGLVSRVRASTHRSPITRACALERSETQASA